MMSVWVHKTRKTVKCFHCGRDIDLGQYQIVCQYYMRVSATRSWQKKMHFHSGWEGESNCWMERAVAELSSRPVVERRGKARLTIPDESRIMRLKLLRRRAAIWQRLKVAMDTSPIQVDKVAHLTSEMEKLATAIEPFGGKPAAW